MTPSNRRGSRQGFEVGLIIGGSPPDFYSGGRGELAFVPHGYGRHSPSARSPVPVCSGRWARRVPDSFGYDFGPGTGAGSSLIPDGVAPPVPENPTHFLASTLARMNASP